MSSQNFAECRAGILGADLPQIRETVTHLEISYITFKHSKHRIQALKNRNFAVTNSPQLKSH